MSCPSSSCEPTCNKGSNGYVCIIVLYILLAIILGSCIAY